MLNGAAAGFFFSFFPQLSRVQGHGVDMENPHFSFLTMPHPPLSAGGLC